MLTINEFLNAKGKLMEKPHDMMKPHDFPQHKTPEAAKTPGKKQAGKEKNMLPPKGTSKQLPYQAATVDNKGDKPLGELNPLKYPTDLDLGNELYDTPWGYEEETPESLSKMIKESDDIKAKAPMVLSESGNSFHPDPIQSIRYVGYLANNSDNYLKVLVTELKNNGGLAKLQEEISSLPKFI
jgi:hypothetical protein